MAKKKKATPSKKATNRPLKGTGRKSSASSKTKGRKKYLNKDGTPKWLNKDGSVNKRYKKIAKYLTKSGKIKNNAKLPFKKVKKVSTLFVKLYYPTYPEWYTKDGKVRKAMQKYLTKKGELRKGVKLPKGVKTIKDLWVYVQSNKIKSIESKLLTCREVTEFYWIAEERISNTFTKYKKVFMEGKEVSLNYWMLHGHDHIQSMINLPNEYEVTYSICYYKKYKYLFI